MRSDTGRNAQSTGWRVEPADDGWPILATLLAQAFAHFRQTAPLRIHTWREEAQG